MDKHNKIRVWLQAVRAPFFTASVIPVLTGAALVFFRGVAARWDLLPLIVLCAVLFHGATNIANDYFDFKNGVDKPGTPGSSKVIEQRLLEPAQLFRAAWILFGAASLLSLFFIPSRGPGVLVFLGLALLGGYLYTGSPFAYKYLALGDLMVFLLMGPLMVTGTCFILTGAYGRDALAVSLPIGCLVAAILHANNTRDILYDRQARIRTLAGLVGFENAKSIYYFLVGAAYTCSALMIVTGTLPIWSLAVFMTFPAAARNLPTVRKARGASPAALATIDVESAKLHLSFGVLYIATLLLGRWS